MLNYLSDKQGNMSDLFKEVIYKLKYQYQPKHCYIIFASFQVMQFSLLEVRPATRFKTMNPNIIFHLRIKAI